MYLANSAFIEGRIFEYSREGLLFMKIQKQSPQTTVACRPLSVD